MSNVNELQRTVDGEGGATLPEIQVPRCRLSWTLLANGILDSAASLAPPPRSPMEMP